MGYWPLLVITFQVVFACNEEGKLLVGNEVGVLTSPNYNNGPYDPNLRCSWDLVTESEAQADYLIKINITNIDLPEHQRCYIDPLEIIYEDSIPPYLSFCGNTAAEVIILKADSKPVIKFVTGNEQSQHGGFRIEYSLIKERASCDGFQCKHTEICIPNGKACDGNPDCPDGSDEEGCGHKVKTPTSCGVPKITPELGNGNDRIIGGQDAVPFSWPWQVSIQSNYVFPSGHTCGGSLVNELWVLTAAHCVVGSFFKVFRVKVGLDSQYNKAEGEQMRYVDSFYLHPEYNRFKGSNDLALIKLASPVKLSDTVSTVCLPSLGERIDSGFKLHATGWGDDFVKGPTKNLKQVEIPTIDWQKCSEMHENTRPIAEKTLCTGSPEGGKNPCFGDSGGPLVAQKDSKWTIYGVVSWGPSICGEKEEPTVFSEVSQFLNWIEEIIATK